MTGDVEAVAREVTARRRTVLRRVLPVITVGLILLGSLFWWNSSVTVVPAEGPWMIGVSYPVGDSAHCYDHPVKETFYTTDWPGSWASVSFVDEATRGDVVRVLECMEDSLTSGDIEVVQTTPPS